MDEFTFNSALMHFQNARGPKGFIWKFILTYILGLLVFGLIYLGAMSTLVPGLVEASTDPYAVQTFFSQSLGNIILFYVILIVTSLIFGAVFESAALRHYVRGEGFSIRFSSDELRLIGVYFFWVLTILLVYVVVVLPLGIIAGLIATAMNSSAQMVMLPMFLIIPLIVYAALIFVSVRLAPAAAITIRDKKLTFYSARKATKGRFWAMFAAYLIMFILMYVVLIIVAAIIGVTGLAVFGSAASLANGNPQAIMDMISNPSIWIFGIFATLIFGGLYSMFYFAFQGIAARAANTDPDWSADFMAAATFS